MFRKPIVEGSLGKMYESDHGNSESISLDNLHSRQILQRVDTVSATVKKREAPKTVKSCRRQLITIFEFTN